jgi:hypothetical protein
MWRKWLTTEERRAIERWWKNIWCNKILLCFNTKWYVRWHWQWWNENLSTDFTRARYTIIDFSCHTFDKVLNGHNVESKAETSCTTHTCHHKNLSPRNIINLWTSMMCGVTSGATNMLSRFASMIFLSGLLFLRWRIKNKLFQRCTHHRKHKNKLWCWRDTTFRYTTWMFGLKGGGKDVHVRDCQS